MRDFGTNPDHSKVVDGKLTDTEFTIMRNKCREAKHIVKKVNVGRSIEKFTCDICKYIWEVDCSD